MRKREFQLGSIVLTVCLLAGTAYSQSGELGGDWVVGANGVWTVADGFLTCDAPEEADPLHVWVNRDFGTGDYTVQCDVRMLNWQDGDRPRAGVSVRVNPEDGERALNLLFHDDVGSIDLLNDAIAWGTRSEFDWDPGAWYTMSLTAEGNVLTGSIAELGGDLANAHTVTWDDARNGERSPGFPGLAGSSAAGLSVQYDNFQVIVDGEVVFSDDFGENIPSEWIVARSIPHDAWTVGQLLDGITLTATAPSTGPVGSLTVTEQLPAGLEPASMDASAGTTSFEGGVIAWTLTDLTGSATLTYAVVAPRTKSVASLQWGGSAVDGTGDEVPLDGSSFVRFTGRTQLALLSFNIFETFSYPLNNEANENEGKALTEVDAQRGLNWASGWADSGTNSPNALDTRIIDNGLVQSQPQEFNPGNFSLKVTGDASNGIGRQFTPVASGEVWISFTFLDEGPAQEHWAGMTVYASDGSESSFIGKPWNSATAGVGNLSGDDSVSDIDYTQPNHFLVRLVLSAVPGQNDSVYLWLNPDSTDRLDTFDAGGANNDDIVDVAEIRLRRGGASGSAYFDNIWISSDPALPPAGAGRVDLTLNDPNRDPGTPAWDVVSIDQFDDVIVGELGFGHDNDNDHYLVVSGFVYFPDLSSNDQIVAFGLPPDHMSGLNGHILGPYNNQVDMLGLKNSIKFQDRDGQRGPFTFQLVPPGNYSELRAAMTVGNGFGILTTTLNYADGTSELTETHADDWYRDPTDSDWMFGDVALLVDGMNRLSEDNSFDNAFDPAVNEDAVEVNPDKVLESVTLELDVANSGSDGNIAYNLFDIWAQPVAPETPVRNWDLH